MLPPPVSWGSSGGRYLPLALNLALTVRRNAPAVEPHFVVVAADREAYRALQKQGFNVTRALAARSPAQLAKYCVAVVVDGRIRESHPPSAVSSRWPLIRDLHRVCPPAARLGLSAAQVVLRRQPPESMADEVAENACAHSFYSDDSVTQ